MIYVRGFITPFLDEKGYNSHEDLFLGVWFLYQKEMFFWGGTLVVSGHGQVGGIMGG